MKKIFLLFFLISNVSASENVKDVVRALQKQYESIQAIEGNFVQIKRSKRFDEMKFTGKMVIQRPGKMRWDYDEPKGKAMVSDGTTLTLYDPTDNQAIISKISPDQDLPPPFSFLWGKGNLEKDFNVSFSATEKSKEKNVYVLDIVPKNEIPNVSKVLLWVQLGNPTLITQTRVFYVFGEENEIRFSNQKINPTVVAKQFKIDFPKGVIKVDATMGKN